MTVTWDKVEKVLQLITVALALIAAIATVWQAAVSSQAREDGYQQVRLERQIEDCGTLISSGGEFKNRLVTLQSSLILKWIDIRKIDDMNFPEYGPEMVAAQLSLDELRRTATRLRLTASTEILSTLRAFQEEAERIMLNSIIDFSKSAVSESNFGNFDKTLETLIVSCRSISQMTPGSRQ